MIFLPVVLIVALVVAMGGDSDDKSARAARPVAVRACDLLSREQARASLDGRIYRKAIERRNSADNDACTYFEPSGRRAVTVGLYPAADFDDMMAVLPRLSRETILNRSAAYDRRLGYLIELPDRPYYLQVTYSHVVHTHADRPASRRLAKDVLTGQTSPAARFICSLSGEPS